MLEELLDRLSAQLHIEKATKNEKTEAFTFKIGTHTLELKSASPGFYCSATIAPIPATSNREDFFIHIMEPNFLGQGTGGSAIGIDENEKFLTLSLAVPYEVKYDVFKDFIEDFVNYIDYWKKEIKAFAEKPSAL